MREAIGSAWIFSICLTFIILMTAYLAISVNYAKAFKIKNHIVSKIEENEGYSSSLDQGIETYLTSEGYTAYKTCKDQLTTNGNYNGSNELTDWKLVGTIGSNANNQHSACIYGTEIPKKANDEIDEPRCYYRVITFFRFDLPIVSYFMNFDISGETRPIYDFSGGCTAAMRG